MPRPDFGASAQQGIAAAPPAALPPVVPTSGGRGPSRSSSGRPDTRWIAGVAVIVVAISAFAFHFSRSGATRAAAATAEYLTPASVAAPHVACLDHSSSMADYGRISEHALSAIRSEAATADPVSAHTAQQAAVPATAGLNIWLRVIQKDSYSTSIGDASTVSVQVPSTPGINAGSPDVTDANYTTDSTQWQSTYDEVSKDRAEAASLAHSSLAQVKRLDHVRSGGSDINGCVASLLQVDSHGAAPSVLVVSDLANTWNRSLAGRFGNGRLTIVQACPNGRPAVCQRRLRVFLAAMARLGLERSHVQIYRPEQVNSAVHTWLAS